MKNFALPDAILFVVYGAPPISSVRIRTTAPQRTARAEKAAEKIQKKETMADERTFIMLKPDAVHRGLIADIIKRFEQKGFKLVAMKFMIVCRSAFYVSCIIIILSRPQKSF